MTFDAYIVGLGARTPIGLCAATSAAAARAGITRQGFHPYLVDHLGDPMRVAMDSRMDEEFEGEVRMLELATSALSEAVRPFAAFLPRCAMYLGLPEARPGWATSAELTITQALVERVAPQIPLEHVHGITSGHAAGLMGVQLAIEALGARTCDLAIVGGVDTYLHVDTLEWFDERGRLWNEQDSRSSFVPGEGAAFCVLATRSFCEAHCVTPFARVMGLGVANEPVPLGHDGICVGLGLSKAVRDATRDLHMPEQKVGMIYCDINGERYRTEEFTFSALRNYHPFVDSNVFNSPAECWGDVGAASGPLCIALAVQAKRRRYEVNAHSMVFASSDGGLRGAVVLGAH